MVIDGLECLDSLGIIIIHEPGNPFLTSLEGTREGFEHCFCHDMVFFRMAGYLELQPSLGK